MRRMSCVGANCMQKSPTIRNQPPFPFRRDRLPLSSKKAMFNLNEDNRIVMAQHHTDMRMGVNGMCGQVRQVDL